MTQIMSVIEEIIKVQQSIIGPIALDQARKVSGLTVDNPDSMQLTGNPQQVLGDLVKRYADFFGQASIEVCKDVIREIKPPVPVNELPDILK